MAIFELDGGRSSLVQPMRPRSDSFDADSSALVTDHVSALLGEQVLPVREGGPGGPHLLALDASARPVVVEVVQLLDEAALVRALRHAGGAARLSRSDLARMYAGGAESFEADLAVFRDRSPILASRDTAAGVRLVVVCADVTGGLLDAVDFVTAGLHVEVLRMGVTQGPGGRRYVDVSPLRSSTAGVRRAVEPGPRTGAVQVAPPPSAAVTDPTPVVPAPADAAPTPSVAADGTDAADGPGPRRHAAAGEPDAQRDATAPAAPAPAGPPTPRPAPSSPRSDETTLMPPVPPDGGPQHRGEVDHRPLPELAALAAAERSALELVWHRVRRGQRLTATLRADGLIELPGGSVHADPDDAATVAADLESPTDGWRVWRFGEDGPTLGEAVGVR
ncbi:hypothetical protein [Cellulomonas sp. ES6]|uniref:hypothetical protein n=1 Tax=Cellulomonas sp. ES6 TaxID=3039384 RepID=UPI0024B8723A|nr:hypothetical protein [Cellulomonas sp. ES6]WHP19122.1 hypothetical protein P9841_08555 [Cellulomonas sp. ES6]